MLDCEQNQKIQQDSKSNKNDENFQKREEEIYKLKQSIIGRPGGLDGDDTNQTGNREHEEIDPNLTGAIRSTISPRYSFMPSKEFSTQNQLYSKQSIYPGAGIRSEVNLFDAQNKLFQRQQLLTNSHRYKIDSAVAK